MTSYADAFEHVETWTEAEFLSLPPDGPRIELIDGTLMVSPLDQTAPTCGGAHRP